jgi:calcineurin-like phosphoesterase family protein
MNTWFISDTHFSHANIIKYSKRPFQTVKEMDEALIKNWNDRVKDGDIVRHLGDFAFIRDRRKLSELFHHLKGEKHLIIGNHDKDNLWLPWASVNHYKKIHVNGKTVILLHYGMRVWDKSHHGSFQLYGHSHGSLPGNSQQLDVGVDCWDYRPVTFEEIEARLKTLPPFTNRHHEGEVDAT